MKPLSHPAVTAFGATSIIFMVWLAPLASGVHETLFTFPGSVLAVMIPLYIGFFCTWLFWFLALTLSRHHRSARICVWLVLAILLLRELVEGAYALKPTDDPLRAAPLPPTSVNIAYAVAVVVLLAVLPLVHRHRPTITTRIKWFGTTVLGFVAISGAFTLLQISEYVWQARDLNAPRALHHTAANAQTPTGHRIVWVLMDELSYNQLYEHRFGDLQMPAFDRLAKESTVFMDVRPAGRYTLRIIPQLLSGVPDDEIRMPAGGAPLSVKNTQTGKWQLFDEHQTVFQDAVNAGYSTSVAGWIFPYCRLLPDVLDHCRQVAPGELSARMNTTQSIGWNLKRLFTEPLKNRLGTLRIIKKRPAEYIDTPDILYQHLLADTRTDVSDPSNTFLYFHLNIPHPMGFYDRHTGKFSTANTSYIDNLALCDKYLAELRSALEATGSWNNTDLVIMGDHSWRVYGWSKDQHWTDEDQAASNNATFDDRPGYIVKLAGQTTPNKIDTPFPAIRTRSLVDALISGQIATPDQLAAWAK